MRLMRVILSTGPTKPEIQPTCAFYLDLVIESTSVLVEEEKLVGLRVLDDFQNSVVNVVMTTAAK